MRKEPVPMKSHQLGSIRVRFSCVRVVLFLSLVFPCLLAVKIAHAQAPVLLWTNKVGSKVVAVDAATNVYVGSNGTVFKLSGQGNLLQTTVLSPAQGIPQRDAAGNFYFAG